MAKQIFNKALVQFHTILVEENGNVIAEMASEPVVCRTLEEFSKYLEEAKNEVENFNRAQPNRKQRRSTK